MWGLGDNQEPLIPGLLALHDYNPPHWTYVGHPIVIKVIRLIVINRYQIPWAFKFALGRFSGASGCFIKRRPLPSTLTPKNATLSYLLEGKKQTKALSGEASQKPEAFVDPDPLTSALSLGPRLGTAPTQ